MGVVGGKRQYDGPGIAAWTPWKCPSCAADNIGGIDAGCTVCGSGSAQPQHVGVQPPSSGVRHSGETTKEIWDRHAGEDDLHLPAPAVGGAYDPSDHERTIKSHTTELADVLAREWLAQNPDADLLGAFIAGYQFATQQARLQTTLVARASLPVTADLEALAPEGKARRTIIAALDLFKDQILRDATEEITSGEWCSIEEVEQLITELKTQEGSL